VTSSAIMMRVTNHHDATLDEERRRVERFDHARVIGSPQTSDVLRREVLEREGGSSSPRASAMTLCTAS